MTLSCPYLWNKLLLLTLLLVFHFLQDALQSWLAVNVDGSMRLIIASQSVPLQMDESNTVCIGKSRIPLTTVVTLFNQGATVEEIVQQYPSLKLADVYIVIGYYLRHKPEIDAYLQRQTPNSGLIKSLTGRQERCLAQAHLNTAQALCKIAQVARSAVPAIERRNRVQ